MAAQAPPESRPGRRKKPRKRTAAELRSLDRAFTKAAHINATSGGGK